MKQMSGKGLKFLKVLHVFFVVVLFGGILGSLVLSMNIDFTEYNEAYFGYKSLFILSSKMILHGTILTIIIGCMYGLFTKWGFIKHKWIMIKWILFIIQIVIGLFIINRLTLENIALLETQKELALSNKTFILHQHIRTVANVIQVLITLVIFIISFLKPGYKNRVNQK